MDFISDFHDVISDYQHFISDFRDVISDRHSSCVSSAFVVAAATLTLRFRTKNICCCHFAFAQKTFVAAASLSHKKHLLLPLRFRTKNICWTKQIIRPL
ncbi:hypothetical protein [Lysinibacillus sp. FJAT-14745]|uniref:hypothetical protein n=1 Tax=Lysinibacillus sp. FJAT-14745 TaxID=1704289 RepID=UPI0012E27E73|nr:hypothetical protein [Lysinibacillus sp. FJAT-14745]